MSSGTRIVAISFVPIIVIGLIFGVYLSLNVGSSDGGSSDTLSNGQNGLQLELGLSTTSLLPGEIVSINVSEYNTLNMVNNVSTRSNWPIDSLKLGSCGHSTYPFGIAVLTGVYTAGNLSEGTPLQIFPNVPCPLFILLVTGYLFQPQNDSAVILPENTAPVLMLSQASVSGIYSNGTQKSFTEGEYTVVAGDEWGNVAIQYFSVG